jgi:hypothetical protein
MTNIVVPRDLRLGRPVDHRDGSGHLDRAYERQLRARVRDGVRGAERAFVHGGLRANAGAERAGEAFVIAATSGEESAWFELDQMSAEERGGPFVATTGSVEFASGSDESNPSDGTREPFPTT